jgi:ABC-type polysaccharide/polyol phosphate export permease
MVLYFIMSIRSIDKNLPRFIGVPLDAPYSAQFFATIRDLRLGLQYPHVWALGAIRQITNAYKKTILGPWWITISMCWFVFGLSYLRIALRGSGRSWGEAVSFVGTGFIAFAFLSGAITSSATIFANQQGTNSSSSLPISISIFRVTLANVFDFLHEALVIVLLIAAFGIRPSWNWFQVLPAVITVIIFHLGLIMWLGPLVCRFRDVGPIVSMIQRIAIFLSPIFWSVDQIEQSGQFNLIKWNPYTYFISAFRDPMLNISHASIANPLIVSFIIAFTNLGLGLFVFSYSRSRLNFWATTS